MQRFLRIDPLFLLSTTIILYILRMVGPFVNYLFIPFLLFFFIYTASEYYKIHKFRIEYDVFKYQYHFLIISFFFLFGFMLSSHFIFFAFKELLNIPIFIFLNICFLLYINTEVKLLSFIRIFCKHLIVISFIISIIGLLKLLLQFAGYESVTRVFAGEINGTSLNTDYNYYSLFSLLGLIALFFNKSSFRKLIFFIVFIVLNINILFSASRRGIASILLIWILLYLFGFDFKLIWKSVASRILASIFILGFVAIVSFTAISSYMKRETKQSSDLSPKLQNKIESISNSIGSRYLTLINNETINNSVSLYNEISSENKLTQILNNIFSEEAHDGNLIHNGNFEKGLLYWEPEASATLNEIVKTSFGNGVRISRFDGDEKGWSLQYTGRGIVFYSNHEYIFKFKFRVIKGSGIPFRIGLWSDSWFRHIGDGASLKIEAQDLENGWKQGTCRYRFGMSRTNIPFFLHSLKDSTIIEIADITLTDSDADSALPEYSDEISSKIVEIDKYLILFDSIAESNNQASKNNLFGNGDFSSGTSYWVPYADSTQHELVETPYGKGIRVLRTNGDESYWSLLYDGRPVIYYADHTYQIKFNYKVVQGDTLPFNIGWWVNDANQGYLTYNLPLSIKKLSDGWKEARCSYKFKKTHLGLVSFLNSMRDNTIVDICNAEMTDLNMDESLPIFVDQLEDITVIPLDGVHDSIDLRYNANSFYGPRLNRWLYSKIIFQDSLSFRQKVFGGGFDYLEYMGKTFGETEIDDPHNPFISAFLYSGIIGGIAYIWFMFLVFYYYVKYYKYHIYFFICFLMVFAFSFFSANTHFSIPVLTILSIIPFLTRQIIKNEKESQTR